jgi:hypothetical protein
VKGDDVTLTEAELREVRSNDEWIYYKVWEMKDEFLEDRRGRGVDVVYVHGEYRFFLTIPARTAEETHYGMHDMATYRLPGVRVRIIQSQGIPSP